MAKEITVPCSAFFFGRGKKQRFCVHIFLLCSQTMTVRDNGASFITLSP